MRICQYLYMHCNYVALVTCRSCLCRNAIPVMVNASPVGAYTLTKYLTHSLASPHKAKCLDRAMYTVSQSDIITHICGRLRESVLSVCRSVTQSVRINKRHFLILFVIILVCLSYNIVNEKLVIFSGIYNFVLW